MTINRFLENDMIFNYLLLDFFNILAHFIAKSVAREAIVGGNVARPLQFPYQVAVLVSNLGFGCGGGILNNNSILTAASCVVNEHDKSVSNPLSVLAGTSNLQKIKDAVIIQVSTIYVPREYNHGYSGTTGDIAILKLKDYLNLWSSSNLKTLKLPRSQSEKFAGDKAVITGFGWHWVHINQQNQNGGRNDTLLRFAETDVLSHHLCRHHHPDIGITEKHLCARVVQLQHSQAHGVCVGDGGGPLVYYGMVIGVFSLGPKDCSERIYPAIYTRVSHFVTFLQHAKAGRESLHLRKIHVT